MPPMDPAALLTLTTLLTMSLILAKLVLVSVEVEALLWQVQANHAV